MVLGRRGATAPTRPARGFSFGRDIISELRKVTWPTRQEAFRLTGIVTAVSIAIGVFLGGIDYVFYWIINSLLLGKPA